MIKDLRALLRINRARLPVMGLYLGFGSFTISNFYRAAKGYYDLPDANHEEECEHCKAEKAEREKARQKSN
jgi:hypothetical protein